MLDSDTSLPAARKYLVTVSDSLVYFWNDSNGNVYSTYNVDPNNGAVTSEFYFGWTNENGIDVSNSYALTNKWPGWDAYLTKARGLIAADDANGTSQYVVNLRQLASDAGVNLDGELTWPTGNGSVVQQLTSMNAIIPSTDLDKHALSADRALVASYDTYQEIVDEGYRCCYAYSTGVYGTNTFPALFTSVLNGIAGVSGDVDFNAIRDGILYQLGANSTIDDYMGYVAGDDGYDFDLIDPETMKMQVVVEKPDGSTTTYGAVALEGENHWGFRAVQTDDNGGVVYEGSTVVDDTTGDSTTYAYEVTYTKGNGTTDEHLTWKTNVNVSNFERVSLKYTVVLTNPQSAAGIYGSYDEYGSNNDKSDNYSLYTNRTAVLHPVDSEGNPGADEEYAKPTVSYVVVGATKAWSDGADAHTADTVTVDVLNSDGEQATTLELSSKNSWFDSVALPLGDYSVTETSSFDGYTVSYSGTLDEGFTITNKADTTTTTTTTTTKRAGSSVPSTGDPAAVAGLVSTLAGTGSLAVALGLKRRRH